MPWVSARLRRTDGTEDETDMARRRSTVIAAVLVWGAIGLTGCSADTADTDIGDTPAAPDPAASADEVSEVEETLAPKEREPGPGEQLRVVEGQAWPDGMGEWLAVVVVENPSDELAYFSGGFDVRATSGDGTLLDSFTEYVTVAPSAQVPVVGHFENLDGRGAENLTVETPETATVVEPGSIGSFEVVEAEIGVDVEGNPAVVGSIVSHFADDQEDPQVVAILRDGSGSIVDVVWSFVYEVVPPGGAAEFVAHLVGDVPAGAVPEVYALPTGVLQGS